MGTSFATVTKERLKDIYVEWTRLMREGKTLSYEEADALPIEQVAEECAQYVWEQL